ncbi:hypothetical protein DHEL01_v210603 [Diaporthe helianthi]|uniref:TauD/TfdA-like domain-containing protein n=1 Tax=Diaporthe helianthi TaxID=158607 RepID=A0A2P5HL84_DIAHE|nr:hypothetical protein DHEL01_v210603 [Diaporthe helianthi]
MSSVVAQSMTCTLLTSLLNNAPATPALSVIPVGFPVNKDGKGAWVGSKISDRDFVYHLTERELDEIYKAVVAFKELGLDGSQVGVDTFTLPTLGPRLVELSLDVHNGLGFAVIRGIKPRDYSVEDLTIAYMGIASYVADMRGCQDKLGNMLVHIVANKANEKHHRHSTDPITFHNEEAGDVVSWLTRGAASSGGKCVIASATTVYNVLAATRPDLVRVLARSDWPFALPRYHCRPVLFHENGKLVMNFGRAPLLGSAAHPRKSRLPALNGQQIEALDAVEAIARATEFQFATEAGDMHFINNLSVLHRRDGFVNDAMSQRHLVRMRLRSSTLGWSIPSSLSREWSDAFERQSDKVWHIEPMPEHFAPLRKHPN